jgi:transposase InsO family protein
MDLINMTKIPDDENKYILHVRDHFSRYSWARGITSKRPIEVAACLFDIFTEVGPPRILQSDNGAEFTANVIKEIMSLWPSVKIIRGRPRHPQSQGSVERGNYEITKKLGAWMEEFNSNDWIYGLKKIIYVMNTTISSPTNKSPYEIVYGKQPNSETVWLDHLFKDSNNNIIDEDDISNDIEINQLDTSEVIIIIIFF